MAGSRKPGPQCSDSDRGTIDGGTMCLAQSPQPGPLAHTPQLSYENRVLLPLAMTHEQKMEDAIKSAYRNGYLSKATLNQLPSLGQLVTSIIVVGGVIAGLGVAAGAVASTGVGAVLEGVAAAIVLSLAAIGIIQSGKEVLEGISLLAKFYGTTLTAKTTKDLDEAGKEFASGIAEVGVGTFMMILSIFGGRQGLRMGKSAVGKWNVGELVSEKPTLVKANRIETKVKPNESSAIEVRRAANARIKESPQFQEDMKRVGVTKSQIVRMSTKELPLGFKDPKQFQHFKGELDMAMKRAGLDDAEIGMKGTATTFYSENPSKPLGHHWDADRLNPGDFDLNITSAKMATKLRDANVLPSEKYGVFKTRDIEEHFQELDQFQMKWSSELGRDVNFVGYPKPQSRDLTEFILRNNK